MAAVLVLVVSGVSRAEAPGRVEAPYFEVLGGDPALDALPLKATEVHTRIAGVIAHVTVTQVYVNEGSRPLNVRYVFPGSTRAAVHGLVMQVGDRRVRAQVKEKAEAQRQFDEAKAQGKTATLLTESRPNVFTMNLANVLPKDRLEVTLEYSELLIPERGTYEWVISFRRRHHDARVEQAGHAGLEEEERQLAARQLGAVEHRRHRDASLHEGEVDLPRRHVARGLEAALHLDDLDGQARVGLEQVLEASGVAVGERQAQRRHPEERHVSPREQGHQRDREEHHRQAMKTQRVLHALRDDLGVASRLRDG
ncbi:MAG: hypothetical protein INH41_00910 [Myxococcaceae bacterium]|nr:hypothetical protein [Myxococcaceae bacterium]MCA3010938.1 hypothetical protein [Myxococcaceae bacterium]